MFGDQVITYTRFTDEKKNGIVHYVFPYSCYFFETFYSVFKPDERKVEPKKDEEKKEEKKEEPKEVVKATYETLKVQVKKIIFEKFFEKVGVSTPIVVNCFPDPAESGTSEVYNEVSNAIKDLVKEKYANS